VCQAYAGTHTKTNAEANPSDHTKTDATADAEADATADATAADTTALVQMRRNTQMQPGIVRPVPTRLPVDVQPILRMPCRDMHPGIVRPVPTRMPVDVLKQVYESGLSPSGCKGMCK
jgi:hypothetical protein